MLQTVDRETKNERRNFFASRKAEHDYSRKLRGVGREVGKLIREFYARDPRHAQIFQNGLWSFAETDSLPHLQEALRRYAHLLGPWSRSVALRMLADVSRRDQAEWSRLSRTMSRELHREILQAPTGKLFQELMEDQVRLITSIPIKAGTRVHELVLQNMESGARSESLVREIMRSGKVAEGRAKMIARTETARAASSLIEARATFVGSENYRWRTVRDSDVRESHRKMEGKVVPWNRPPTLDGMTGHAGCVPNCRCYPEPLIPDII